MIGKQYFTGRILNVATGCMMILSESLEPFRSQSLMADFSLFTFLPSVQLLLSKGK